jgi:hypothetical protein
MLWLADHSVVVFKWVCTGWSKSLHKCKFSLSSTTWHLVLTCHNEFRDLFPIFPVLNKLTGSHLVISFCDTGSALDRNHSCRPSLLSDSSLDDIHQTLLHFPRKSPRKFSVQSGLSYGSVHKAVKILKLYVMYLLCTNWRSLIRKNNFITADGLHSSSHGV